MGKKKDKWQELWGETENENTEAQAEEQKQDFTAAIQWFPGHMAKARRLLEENLSMVDIVVELVDARIPFSSRNPEIDRILGTKPRVIAANKKDLADPDVCRFWSSYYKEKGIPIIYTDCKSGNGVKDVRNAIMRELSEKLSRKEERGIKTYTVKTMVVGIPNVGKSTFINRIAGKNVAVTGDKPGVTRGKQWLSVDDNIWLLDTPGLLWPKFEDRRAAYCLACTGAIKDDILDRTDIVSFLIEFLLKNYPGLLNAKYKIDEAAVAESGNGAKDEDERRRLIGHSGIEACARKRGYLLKGGILDTERACVTILDDFRGGMTGKISLDTADVAGGEIQ